MGKVFDKRWQPVEARPSYCHPISQHRFNEVLSRKFMGQGSYELVLRCTKCFMRVMVKTKPHGKTAFKPPPKPRNKKRS